MTDRKQRIGFLMGRFHALKRLMAPENRNTASGDCLAHSQWLALHLISENEGLGLKELAGRLGISSSAATQLVESLVGKGLLERQPSPGDRRALVLTLPEATRRHVEQVRQERLERLAGLFSSLDDAELENLIRIIDKIVDSNNIQ
jgi:DNA-binding MarR family transcriptional regulator